MHTVNYVTLEILLDNTRTAFSKVPAHIYLLMREQHGGECKVRKIHEAETYAPEGIAQEWRRLVFAYGPELVQRVFGSDVVGPGVMAKQMQANLELFDHLGYQPEVVEEVEATAEHTHEVIDFVMLNKTEQFHEWLEELGVDPGEEGFSRSRKVLEPQLLEIATAACVSGLGKAPSTGTPLGEILGVLRMNGIGVTDQADARRAAA